MFKIHSLLDFIIDVFIVDICTEEGTEDIPSEHESSFELDDGHTPSRQDYVLARGRTLSRVQDEKVTTLIQDVGPEVPVFVAVMKPSYVKSQTSALVCFTVLFCQSCRS